MKTIKIDQKEITELIEKTYNIKNIKYMKKGGYEPDSQWYDYFDYIEGELQ